MALTKDSFIKMNDGHRIPVLGLGTYAPEKVPKSHAKEATKVAIDAGFRHIDSAFLYQNEVEVGEAIREKIADGTVKRDNIFYTGKLWSTFHPPELVRPALMKSLNALQLDYIDLYLIHSPKSLKPGEDLIPVDENGEWQLIDVDIRATWEALEACKDEGLVRSIGVSNFNERQLEMILNKPGLKYKPTCNQVECHVYLNRKQLLQFCKAKDIVLVAYCVLGSSRDEAWIDQTSPLLLDDPVLIEIGKNYKKSSAHVAMCYLLQQGIVVLAKSFTPEHIKQNLQGEGMTCDPVSQRRNFWGLLPLSLIEGSPNFSNWTNIFQIATTPLGKVFDFHLTPEDVKVIDGLNRDRRFYSVNLTE